MELRYKIKERENHWQKWWKEKKIFKYDSKSKKPVFSIDTPPPYASSGHLHVGHGMSYSQAEFIARYKRMQGYNVFYPMGFDDNGLPTERYVEKVHKINKNKITKAEFVKLCIAETRKVGKTYEKLFTELGISVDWSLLYQTIDPRSTRIAQKSFIDLYKKGRIERRNDPILWDIKDQTAVSQADLIDLEKTSFLNDIRFKAEDGSPLVISTTRPELIPACVALFVNKKDERYRHLIGKKSVVPITKHTVPILADDAVKIDFGTGLMMVCTWGDQEDIQRWRENKLETRLIIDSKGILNELAGKYKGMKIIEAREEILKDLKKEGLLKEQKEIKHVVNVGERSKTPIEFLPMKQWFIKLLEKKNELIKAGEKVQWHPKHMFVRYKTWVENLKWDWLISRQRYYGVPFPVWYSKKTGEAILANEEELPIDPTVNKPKTLPKGHTSDDVTPETDVMDTWMTSSLTPLINTDWGGKERNIYPMSLRPQGHDIIRTWAFYTITKSFYHHKQKPWDHIMISGMGQDPHGKKMSKSIGNFIKIDTMIDKYGADGFRYWAASAKLGEDLPFQEKELFSGKKFVTKIWNATKFSLPFIKEFDEQKKELEIMDKWLLSKMNKLISIATENFDIYEYSKTKIETEKFFWHVFCNYYLEIVKDRLYNPDKRGNEAKKSAQYTLHKALRVIIKLMAPITPHITEELYQLLYSNGESVHLSSWPKVDKTEIDEKSEKIGDYVSAIISQVRKYKSEQKISLGTELNRLIIESELNLHAAEADLKAVCKVKEIFYDKGTIKCENVPVNVSIE